jgi:hypothetical protein
MFRRGRRAGHQMPTRLLRLCKGIHPGRERTDAGAPQEPQHGTDHHGPRGNRNWAKKQGRQASSRQPCEGGEAAQANRNACARIALLDNGEGVAKRTYPQMQGRACGTFVQRDHLDGKVLARQSKAYCVSYGLRLAWCKVSAGAAQVWLADSRFVRKALCGGAGALRAPGVWLWPLA